MASNLPPGITTTDTEEQPCDVCRIEAGSCICPECDVCGEQGNPRCYFDHFLNLNCEQMVARKKADIEEYKEAIADAELDIERIKEFPNGRWRFNGRVNNG